jgi:23S rRNA (uracil1939-C5)-methyltransferase
VPECGGCQWQHAAYDAQVELKARVLAETMRRAGAQVPPAAVIASGEPFRYRVRGEFHIVFDEGRHRLGFNRRRTWDAIPVDDCLIHHPHITEALPGICAALDAVGAGAARTLQLTCHPSRRELLWEARGGAAAPGLAQALIDALPGYLVHQDGLTLEYDGGLVDGRDGTLMFRVESDAFIQVNHRQAHRLYGEALRMLGDAPGRLVEGYAGFGAMSVMAATRAAVEQRPSAITLIEESPVAVMLGRLHLKMHGVDGIATYLPGRVEARLGELDPGGIDTLLLDPPRAGCAPEVADAIGRLRPGRVVYASCDPATLGRDLHRLEGHAYRVVEQTLVDMFPQTYHIESVTVLVARG